MYTDNSNGVVSANARIRTLTTTRSLLEEEKEAEQTSYVEEERANNLQLQQQHAFKLVIDGLPQNVEDKQLLDEVVKLFKAMKATVNPMQIEAVFRVGHRGTVVVKFFNPLMVPVVLRKGSSLRDLDLYEGSRINIAPSLCREYNNIKSYLRKAKKEGRIHRYRVWSGTNQVMVNQDDDFVDITHRNDLIELGIVDGFEN